MTTGPADGHVWEEIGGIGVDAATVAFASASVLGEDSQLVSDEDLLTGSPRGYVGSLVLQWTREDCPLPVEVRRDRSGAVEAARMCFTDDVDETEGSWRAIGRLDIPDGRCLACDPYCPGPVYRLYFDVAPGGYVAEVFEFTEPDGHEDVLALRIRLDRTGVVSADNREA